jgi:hypothetical protein
MFVSSREGMMKIQSNKLYAFLLLFTLVGCKGERDCEAVYNGVLRHLLLYGLPKSSSSAYK